MERWQYILPVNSCLVASAKEYNLIGSAKEYDKRTFAGKRRELARKKAPEVMLDLLDTAVTNGIMADYVLFGCWFANPSSDYSH